MSISLWFVAVAVVTGLVLGPFAVSGAAAAQPPLRWSDLGFVFAGSAGAVFLVLAFQVLLRNDKAFFYGWSAFALLAVHAVATGVSALVASVITYGPQPHSFLFLAVGGGMLLATFLLRMAFGSRLKPAG